MIKGRLIQKKRRKNAFASEQEGARAFDGKKNGVLCSLTVKGFDTTNFDSVVDNSFLESNRAVIIDLCDRVWTVVL